uniref:Uncharacterized protein n=1 Tax=Anguilla anguilla TaxID=7936 RepID=A0A0E9UI30_ANGAN
MCGAFHNSCFIGVTNALRDVKSKTTKTVSVHFEK